MPTQNQRRGSERLTGDLVFEIHASIFNKEMEIFPLAFYLQNAICVSEMHLFLRKLP